MTYSLRASGADVRVDGITGLSLSRDGVLAYTTESFNAPEEVAWVRRSGETEKVDSAWARHEEFEALVLSPDGGRAAVVVEEDNRGDVWIKHLDRGPLSRLTFEGDYNGYPSWSPDGSVLYFRSVGAKTVLAADLASGPSSVTNRVVVRMPEQNDY